MYRKWGRSRQAKPWIARLGGCRNGLSYFSHTVFQRETRKDGYSGLAAKSSRCFRAVDLFGARSAIGASFTWGVFIATGARVRNIIDTVDIDGQRIDDFVDGAGLLSAIDDIIPLLPLDVALYKTPIRNGLGYWRF